MGGVRSRSDRHPYQSKFGGTTRGVLKVYTMQGCGYCKKQIEGLQRASPPIPFVKLDTSPLYKAYPTMVLPNGKTITGYKPVSTLREAMKQ